MVYPFLRSECGNWYNFGSKSEVCNAFAVFLTLLYLCFLEHLLLPVDIFLVEAFHLLLSHVLATFLPQVGTKSALSTLLVLLLSASRSKQLFPFLSQGLVLNYSNVTSS